MDYDYEYLKKEVQALTGIDLNAYKEKQMKRRIDNLVEKRKIDGYDKYVQALKSDTEVFDDWQSYYSDGSQHGSIAKWNDGALQQVV